MAKATIALARALRRSPSMTERRLWKLLRDRRMASMKFRRQFALGPYVVDFVCFYPRLVIEADGPFHDPERDIQRDAWLTAEGFKVIRLTNREIEDSPEAVLEHIRQIAGR